MRALARAVAYLATGTADGRRVAGPDEDEFSLLASALERVVEPTGEGASPAELVVVGAVPEGMDWALPALSGSLAPARRAGEGGPALVAALRLAEEGSGGPVVVLAVDLPERSGRPSVADSGPGAGAVAFLWREGSGGGLGGQLAQVRVSSSVLATAFELYRASRDPSPGRWAGDWEADPREGRALDFRRYRRLVNLPTTALSEGAYISRARYRESLPSRWRFAAQRCARCSALTFPARAACRACGAREGLTDVALPRDGALVVATTVIGSGGQPTEFDPQVEVGGPYEVVLAELAPGARVTLQVTDAEPGSIRIGDLVDTRLRRLYPMDGEWRYGRKAVPRSRA